MELQKTKIQFTSPFGEVIVLDSFESVKIQRNFDQKVSSFSVQASVFDETEVKKIGIGSKVEIYSCKESENIDDHLIFKGMVLTNPKKLNRIKKSYEFTGYDSLYQTQFLLVNESYQDQKISDIVYDLFQKYMTNYYTIGYIEETDYKISVKFKDTFLYSALEKLAEALGFTFYVDLEDKFYFQNPQNLVSNTKIKMGDYWQGTASFSYDASKLVNRLTVYGGKALSQDVTQYVYWDQISKEPYEVQNRTFSLWHRPRDSSSGKVEVVLFGYVVGAELVSVPLRMGVEGLHSEEEFDCMLNYNEKTITLTDSFIQNILPQFTDPIRFEITYRYEYDLITKLEDKASMETYGLRENIVKFPNISDNIALIDRARAYLRKYSKPILMGSLSTWLDNWDVGETVKVEIETEEGYFVDEWLQITEKSIHLSPGKIKIDLKFEQPTQLKDVIKNILERLEDLEKQNENEVVQQIELLSDNIQLQELFRIIKHQHCFTIGRSKIGGRL